MGSSQDQTCSSRRRRDSSRHVSSAPRARGDPFMAGPQAKQSKDQNPVSEVSKEVSEKGFLRARGHTRRPQHRRAHAPGCPFRLQSTPVRRWIRRRHDAGLPRDQGEGERAPVAAGSAAPATAKARRW